MRESRPAIVSAVMIVLVIAAPLPCGEFDDLVKVVIDGASTDAERAAKLNSAADDLSDNPDYQKRFYLKAFDYGIKSAEGLREADVAVAGLERFGAAGEGEIEEMRLRVMRKRYALAKGQERRNAAASLVDVMVSRASALLESGNPKDALAIYKEAIPVARSASLTSKSGKLQEKIRECNARLELDNKVEGLKERLRNDPKDDKTREAIIRFYVVELDDPSGAAKLVADTTELELATCVRMVAGDQTRLSGSECLELAAWYEKIGRSGTTRGQINTLLRARDYYEHAMKSGNLSSVEKLKAKMALKGVSEKLDEAGYLPPGILRKGVWIDLLKYVDPSSPKNRGRIERKGQSVAIKGVKSSSSMYSTGRIYIPISVDGEYQIQVVATFSTQESYTSMSIDLPIGPGRSTNFATSYYECGVQGVNGYSWGTSVNPTRKRVDLRSKIPHLIEVWVRPEGGKVGIAAAIDNKKVVAWTGKISQFRAVSGDNLIGLGIRSQPFIFTAPRLKIISGEGRVVTIAAGEKKPKPAPAPAPKPAAPPSVKEAAPPPPPKPSPKTGPVSERRRIIDRIRKGIRRGRLGPYGREEK